MIASLIILAFLIIQKGEIPADSKIGRLLMDFISKVPKLDQSQFDKIMNNTTQVRERERNENNYFCHFFPRIS